jgi:hypothetical protein
MLRYPQKIKAIEPDNADIRLLQQLVEQRRQLVEDKRRFVNRIINTLKQYYPQPLEWFSHRGSLLLCADYPVAQSATTETSQARHDPQLSECQRWPRNGSYRATCCEY